MHTERVCLEYEKLPNNYIYREVIYEALVEKLKDESCREILAQQEGECFEVDDTINTN